MATSSPQAFPVAVLASGRGSNLAALIDAREAGTLPIKLTLVAGDKADAPALRNAEAHGIPTPEANAEGLRITRMAIYLARGIRLDGLPDYEREKAMIASEVRAIVDRVLEMGDGDAAVGTVRAFAAEQGANPLTVAKDDSRPKPPQAELKPITVKKTVPGASA